MRILGINGDRDFCECCGKTGLKKVVWIEKDDSSIVHYGTTCASKKHLHMPLVEIQHTLKEDFETEVKRIVSTIEASDEYKSWKARMEEARELELVGIHFAKYNHETRITMEEKTRKLCKESPLSIKLYDVLSRLK